MGILKLPLPVKLICAVTFTVHINRNDLFEAISSKIGGIDLRSPEFDFRHTDYYEKEMGKNLVKQYLSFVRLVNGEELPQIKIKTNILEKRFAYKKQQRTVNLDPGYLEKAKMILASTKNFSHRVYLGGGIFGDLQYRFRRGTFTPNEWTYPDYRENEVISFFNSVREKYCTEVDEWQNQK
jgi:hypothetical protein